MGAQLTMNMKIDYGKCIAFIERTNRIRLYDFQKEMLWSLCQGEPVWACRCAGRTMIAEGLGKYIAYLLDTPLFMAEQEATVCIPYTTVVENSKLLTSEFIEQMRNTINPEQFKREYCCEGRDE